jgi:hypothetical protein
VQLTVNGQMQAKAIEVRDDPRIDVTTADRKAWTDAQAATADLWKRALAAGTTLQRANTSATVTEGRRLATDVQGRLSGLYTELGRWTGRPTSDQLSELQYYREIVERLEKIR